MNRNIYSYNNGVRDLAADPAVLWRKMAQACKSRPYGTWDSLCDTWMRMAMPSEPVSAPAPMSDDRPTSSTASSFDPAAWLDFQAELVEVIREAFGVVPLDEDGRGLTEEETLSVLFRFMEWREEKKTSGGAPPFSSTPTDGHLPESSRASSDASTTSVCMPSS